MSLSNVKSTDFITLDIAQATIHDFAVAADDATMVMRIQITHPDLPGKRWFRVNAKDTGYISRYTRKGEDQKALCFWIAANPRNDLYIIKARYAVARATGGDSAVKALEPIVRISETAIARYINA